MSLNWWRNNNNVGDMLENLKLYEVTKPHIIIRPDSPDCKELNFSAVIQKRDAIFIAMKYAKERLSIPLHKYFLAIYYMDIYLNRIVHLWEATGSLMETAFHMAYESHNNLFIHQALRLIYPFPPGETITLERVEGDMRNVFGRNPLDAIYVPTSFTFFDYFGEFIVNEEDFEQQINQKYDTYDEFHSGIKERALNLLTTFMEDFKTHNFILPSHQACMAIYIIRHRSDITPAWPERLARLTGYSTLDIAQVTAEISTLQLDPEHALVRRWG